MGMLEDGSWRWEISPAEVAPIPRIGRRRYLWHEMKVGDSFLFPPEVRTTPQAGGRLPQTGPAKYTLRKTAEGVRCWRVK